MIKFIEDGNFTPVVRIGMIGTGIFLVLAGRELHWSMVVPQIGILIKTVGILSYRASGRHLRPFDTSFKKTLATYKDKKRYEEDTPVWISLMGGCVALYCWPAARRAQTKMISEKKRKKIAEAVALEATAITANGVCVIADITQNDGGFFLGLSTRRPEKEMEKTRHRFASMRALSMFLESQTILRIGDFKSSIR